MAIALAEPIIMFTACWPSTRNLIVIHALPFSMLPLVGGVFYFFDYRLDRLGGDEPYLGSLLAVLTIGATVHAIALYCGFKYGASLKSAVSRLMEKIGRSGTRAPDRLRRFVTVLALFSAALQIFAYVKMGFAPLFAARPFDAKYFAGEYGKNYAPVAPFLRIGFQIFVAIAPLFMLCFPKKSVAKVFYLGVVFLSVGVVFLSLKRGPIAAPFIDFLLAVAVFYKRGKYASVATFSYVAIFAFGSATNSILAYILGFKTEVSFEDIFAGVPDISDLLQFWSGFQTRDYELSLGRTVLGALVPYRYDWNMSVVTKLAVGASRDVASGGFRLPDAVNGYAAFSYVGAVLWSAFSGAIAGIQLSLLKSLTQRKDLNFYQFYMMYFVMMSFTGFVGSFLNISWDSIVAAFFVYIVVLVLIGRFWLRNEAVPSSI